MDGDPRRAGRLDRCSRPSQRGRGSANVARSPALPRPPRGAEVPELHRRSTWRPARPLVRVGPLRRGQTCVRSGVRGAHLDGGLVRTPQRRERLARGPAPRNVWSRGSRRGRTRSSTRPARAHCGEPRRASSSSWTSSVSAWFALYPRRARCTRVSGEFCARDALGRSLTTVRRTEEARFTCSCSESS